MPYLVGVLTRIKVHKSIIKGVHVTASVNLFFSSYFVWATLSSRCALQLCADETASRSMARVTMEALSLRHAFAILLSRCVCVCVRVYVWAPLSENTSVAFQHSTLQTPAETTEENVCTKRIVVAAAWHRHLDDVTRDKSRRASTKRSWGMQGLFSCCFSNFVSPVSQHSALTHLA